MKTLLLASAAALVLSEAPTQVASAGNEATFVARVRGSLRVILATDYFTVPS